MYIFDYTYCEPRWPNGYPTRLIIGGPGFNRGQGGDTEHISMIH